MHQNLIRPGIEVTFESDGETQIGTLHTIKTDISNGAQIAIIHVTGTIDDSPWSMPINEIYAVNAG